MQNISWKAQNFDQILSSIQKNRNDTIISPTDIPLQLKNQNLTTMFTLT
jgi:hypothetical protein